MVDEDYRPDITAEIRRGLEAMIEPGQVFEVRSWDGDRVSSGYFDNIPDAVAAIEKLDGADPSGIYLTPNPVNPDLLARRANRMKISTKKDSSTSDGDIVRRRWLLIDVDAKRASGISATDEEHGTALERAVSIAADLAERGWPEPVRADSANGGHLAYRIDLPNDEKSTALVKAVLGTLDAIYSDDVAEVDTGVYNASRIWKVYGTVSRKGDHTTTRPHRRARLLDAPETLEAVTREQLAAVAIMVPAADPSLRPKIGTLRVPGEAIDLEAWLRDHGIRVASEKPYLGGTLYKLDTCPFDGKHTDGAFCIQFPSGAIHAGCHHQSCGAGQQRWPELRERVEGPRPAIAPQRKAISPATETAVLPADLGEDTHPEIRNAAVEVLQHGDPLKYTVAAYNLDHVGDEVLGQCCALSLASRTVLSSKGLHISTTGESGKGKSDGYTTFLKQVPAGAKLNGAFSDKYLYYKGSEGQLAVGTVLAIDDKDLSDPLQELVKEATSDFRNRITLHTVDIKRKAADYEIPERCVLWLAKVEGIGDAQIKNRMLNVWVDDSEEQDRAVVARMMAEEARDDDEDASEERREVAISRAIWEILDEEGIVDVNLSRFALRVRFGSVENRRNPQIFKDMVKSVARLNAVQRDRRTLPNGTVRIYATEADFRTAEKVFTALHGEKGGQHTHLTQAEQQLINVIAAAGLEQFTISRLQELTNLSPSKLHKLIKGEKTEGAQKCSGLLDKVAFISQLDVSESVSHKEYDPDGRGESPHKTVSRGRRSVVWRFDMTMYRGWKQGVAVYLEPETAGNRPISELRINAENANFCDISAKNSAEIKKPISSEIDETERDIERKKEREIITAKKKKSDSIDSPDHVDEIAPDSYIDPAAFRSNSNKTAKKPPIDEQRPERPPYFCETGRTNPQKIAKIELNPDSQTQPVSRVLGKVNPADFTPLPDKYLIEPCPGCGGRMVHYTERYQTVKARRGETAIHICRDCYQAAKRAAVAAIQPLPGIVPVDEIEHVEHPENFGRCDICKMERVAYRHAGSSTGICSECYAKLVREQVDIR